MLRKMLFTLAILVLPVLCFAQYDETSWPVVDVGAPAPSATKLGTPGSTITWLSGHVYHLQGVVYLDTNVTLVIQAGTIIKGDPGQAAEVTCLVIPRKSRIVAKGTPKLPIIFTGVDDLVADTSDIPDIATSRGLWGGIIIEGRSFTCAANGQGAIEGIDTLTLGYYAKYGGGTTPDCNDNSGTMQYVSIRYAGSIWSANVEVNCLSLAGVGSGTTIDHIDTYYALDDDIECWGGNVNVLYTAIIYGDDDGWDTDECWTGIKQFGLMVKDPRWGDRETENDGRASSVFTDTASVSFPGVPSGWGCAYPSYALNANLTMIGQGKDFSGSAGDPILWRDDYRAYWYNNVFMEQPEGAAIIESKDSTKNDLAPNTTRNIVGGAAAVAAGHPLADWSGNFWYHTNMKLDSTKNIISLFSSDKGGSAGDARVRSAIFPGNDTTLTGKNHGGINPQLVSYEVVNPPVRHEAIDPRPAVGSPLRTTVATVPAYAIPNPAYTPTTYAGAFAPDQPMWCQAPWCTAYEYKILPHPAATACGGREGKPTKVIGSPAPSSTKILTDLYLTADTIWHLQGVVYMDSGRTLFIEPGTTIKGDIGQAANVTCLVIPRGARIMAMGTKEEPIIFTGIDDDVDDPGDIPDIATSRGLWGGIIIEGKSFTCIAGGQAAIEGIDTLTLGYYAKYGGGSTPNCNDNSGTMQYVSIRYAGSIWSANVEVNALSLAGVGSATTVDHIESYYALDDDIECWGGNVNVLYTVIVYGDDDGWDTDECWTGIKQFGLMVKDPRWGDRETENDGRASSVFTDTASVSFPGVPSGWGCAYPSYTLNANLTLIGQGKDFSGSAGDPIYWRDDYRGYWYNNVFMEQPEGAALIESKDSTKNDLAPNTTRNIVGGAAAIAAGHPLADWSGNFWYHTNMKLDSTKNIISLFSSDKGGSAGDTRVRSAIFPGNDTTLTGKNHGGLNPLLTSYEVVNPPVRHGWLNPVPKAPCSPLINSADVVPAYAIPNAAYTPTTYVGAFDPNVPLEESWVWGWTVVSDCYGILGTAHSVSCSCCTGTTGNVNMIGIVDLSDLSALVSFLTGGGYVLPCSAEANINNIGIVDLSDLSSLVSFLTGGGYVLPNCN